MIWLKKSLLWAPIAYASSNQKCLPGYGTISSASFVSPAEKTIQEVNRFFQDTRHLPRGYLPAIEGKVHPEVRLERDLYVLVTNGDPALLLLDEAVLKELQKTRLFQAVSQAKDKSNSHVSKKIVQQRIETFRLLETRPGQPRESPRSSPPTPKVRKMPAPKIDHADPRQVVNAVNDLYEKHGRLPRGSMASSWERRLRQALLTMFVRGNSELTLLQPEVKSKIRELQVYQRDLASLRVLIVREAAHGSLTDHRWQRIRIFQSFGEDFSDILP